jgi:UMF1 family MFS transporter
MNDVSDLKAATTRRGMVGWALYDWANSPFTTLIITFVFAVYFSRGIVGDEVQGQVLWGYVAGISAAIIALLSPLLGAIADAGGRRKPWILAFSGLCIVCSGLLWFAEPTANSILLAMTLVILGSIGFEFGIVFNNAMLGEIVSPKRLGRWSGWAWGVGYAGGLAALFVMLFGFIQTEAPLFGVSTENAANIRAVGPLVAIWFALFVIPLLLFTPDRPAISLPVRLRVRYGLWALGTTLRGLNGEHANVFRFLIARMFYNDGLVIVFVLGGVYAAGRFNMVQMELIQFGIVLNVTAGLGAVVFAWVDDWVGSKVTIFIALIGLSCTSLGAVIVDEVTWFWVWGAALGIFVGPAQAASRSFMAHLAPPELRTEFFGLFSLSGKATAFLGPTAAAMVTAWSGSQSMGLGMAVIFFVVGLCVLLTVRTEGSSKKMAKRCPA